MPRMYLNTEYFHIITQGINKSYVFDSPTDIKQKVYIQKVIYIENNISLGQLKKR